MSSQSKIKKAQAKLNKLKQNLSGDYLDTEDESMMASQYMMFHSKVKAVSPKVFWMDSQSSDEKFKYDFIIFFKCNYIPSN